MLFSQGDTGRWIKGCCDKGDWTLERQCFFIKYHPQHTALVTCVVGSCVYEGTTIGLMVQIREIIADYKRSTYEFAIKTILSDTLLKKHFGIQEIEIPF